MTKMDLSRDQILRRHREAAEDVIDQSTYRSFIDGEWAPVENGETFGTYDPTTGEKLADIHAGTANDIDRAVQGAREAFEENWADTSPRQRQEVLNAIADQLEANREELATLESLDSGKLRSEAKMDIDVAIDHFRYFAGMTRSIEGKTVAVDEGHVRTFKEPYGVVGQIIAWNFPLLLAAVKLSPALAAGNTVVLKPAEETPLSILRVLEFVEDIVPDGVVNVVTGRGEKAGAALVEHAGVDKLAFTGSSMVGSQVMRNAAENITDVTLELGGKSPLIVFPDADLSRAVRIAHYSIFFNAGECCTAGSRLFVHEDVKDEFVELFVNHAENLRVGDPLDEDTDVGPKTSTPDTESTLQYLRELRESDHTVLSGGAPPSSPALEDGNFVLPTIVTDIDNDTKFAQEEIFGPVEIVMEWSDYEAMIQQANDVRYGLAAGIVTDDLERAHKTIQDLEAGTIWVNKYNHLPAGQPFGGYKQSGIGREGAAETLNEYLQTKTANIGW